MTTRVRRRIVGSILIATILASCGGAAPLPSPSPTPTPSPSPTPTPAPSASHTATPDDAAAVFQAYLALVADPDRSFHLHQAATVVIDGTTVGTIVYDLEVSDGDFAAIADVLGSSLGIVAVDETMWIKEVDKDWVAVGRDDSIVAEMLEVFKYTSDPEALMYVATTMEGDTTLYHYRNRDPLPYQTGTMRDLGVTGSIDDLTFVVERDGTPRSIEFHSVAEMPNAATGATQRVEAASAVEFTKVGESIPIKPPI